MQSQCEIMPGELGAPASAVLNERASSLWGFCGTLHPSHPLSSLWEAVLASRREICPVLFSHSRLLEHLLKRHSATPPTILLHVLGQTGQVGVAPTDFLGVGRASIELHRGLASYNGTCRRCRQRSAGDRAPRRSRPCLHAPVRPGSCCRPAVLSGAQRGTFASNLGQPKKKSVPVQP